MGRIADQHLTLPDGRVVGYGLVERGDIYRVRFLNPDGNRVELTTGCRSRADAVGAAAKVILKVYAPEHPAEPRRTTWEDAVRELSATPHLRPDTIRDYAKVIAVFRSIIPSTRGPAEVSADHAARFVRVLGASKYTRAKSPAATEYARSANTVRSHHRKLRSLWAKHFRELGYVTHNPWAAVKPPAAVAHRPRVPTEDVVARFFAWLDARYPDWELLRLVLEVKALSGCRTLDLCQLRSDQVSDGCIHFTADQTKTRTARTLPLPADLFAQLRRIAGPELLWQRYTEDARRFRPGTRGRDTFDPKTLYWAVTNIFREYSKANPAAPLKAHDLRRRAITLTAMTTQSMDATAQAIGIDPQTARKHYLDAQRAFDGAGVMRKMADVLRPKRCD